MEAVGSEVNHIFTQNGSYSAQLIVSDGTNTVLSNSIDIQVGTPPDATITAPSNGTLFRAGDVLTFLGSATDDEPLTEDNYRWDVRLQHNEHFHPEINGLTGSSTLDFTTYDSITDGHDFHDDTGFEITLTVTDSNGLSDTDTIFIFPEKVDLTFESNIAGMQFVIDGVSFTSGDVTYDSAINFQHTVSAPQFVFQDGLRYAFDEWSTGETETTLNLTLPDTNQTYTALYVPDGVADQVIVGTSGDDTLVGGVGNDVIIGNAGDDVMTGGGSSNIYRYLGPWYNEREDIITDFTPGIDKLDVGALFLSATHNSNDPFTDHINLVMVGSSTVVEGQFKGDNKPNFERPLVTLEGLVNLSAADFIF